MAYMKREWLHAHLHASEMAEKAYDAAPVGEREKAWKAEYNRIMDLLEHLSTMREPVPDQARIDELSAQALRGGA